MSAKNCSDSSEARQLTILMADDDEDDRFLAAKALNAAKLPSDLRTVADGEELLAYLRREGRFAALDAAPKPGLILLDLNMPRKDGREVLAELRDDPVLKLIPIVVLTTSRTDIDVLTCYELGANSYIKKPSSFQELVGTLRLLGHYWLEIDASALGHEGEPAKDTPP